MKAQKICTNPKIGDVLKDTQGEIWSIVTTMTMFVAGLAIRDGEVFVYVDNDTDSSLYHQFIGRAYRPETKEKHLNALASAYINSLSGYGIISGDNNIDVMEVLGLDKNNAVEREYATKLLSDDLVPFIKQKWAQMQNLGAL